MSAPSCAGNLGPRGIRARAVTAVVLLALAVGTVVWVRVGGQPPSRRWIALAPFAAGALNAFQALAGT